MSASGRVIGVLVQRQGGGTRARVAAQPHHSVAPRRHSLVAASVPTLRKERTVAVVPRHLPDDDLRMLTPEEFDVILDERARRSLNMSLAEFLRALDEGNLPDLPAAAHLELLVRARAR